jgi:hypothetical protein
MSPKVVISGMPLNCNPFHGPVRYVLRPLLHTCNSGEPCVSITRTGKERNHWASVLKSVPLRIPERNVFVKCSKLWHSVGVIYTSKMYLLSRTLLLLFLLKFMYFEYN